MKPRAGALSLSYTILTYTYLTYTILWCRSGNHTATIWQPFGNHLATRRQPFGNRAIFSQMIDPTLVYAELCEVVPESGRGVAVLAERVCHPPVSDHDDAVVELVHVPSLKQGLQVLHRGVASEHGDRHLVVETVVIRAHHEVQIQRLS